MEMDEEETYNGRSYFLYGVGMISKAQPVGRPGITQKLDFFPGMETTISGFQIMNYFLDYRECSGYRVVLFGLMLHPPKSNLSTP